MEMHEIHFRLDHNFILNCSKFNLNLMVILVGYMTSVQQLMIYWLVIPITTLQTPLIVLINSKVTK